ncbi:aminodeoxychorismate synthase component I [Gemmobacter fulvus]|uniref:Aminodeoxychorismate synthase component I n=1 Tax=Gemmobacter fulvus TaxID=2840474 RepID=A0A975P8B4_9RHOB|nr:aminodeoxychorismate synthase component I [Gemmobacter fulvus]MBT9244332.1 aminodeoxychorismate synthase component I [Gemmobacter fulvus]QWK91217.1 aminodeoxychorismate synthase component I [Gemmobacter fulvus]
MILLEHGPSGRPALFDAPREVVVAEAADAVLPALARLDAARAAGAWVAGYVSYEAGYALEDKLAALMPAERAHPLLAFGIYDAPQDAAAALATAAAAAPGVYLAPLQPMVSRDAYGAAFETVAAYIAAGDCYQINLTFPMQTSLTGTPLGLYGALRARQSVGLGAYLDLGTGPVIVSRSPELFFSCSAAGRIEARPMKGTAPRGADPQEDAELAAELYHSEKTRAENLMIVDLLRNDISRLAEVGSVRVPELFAVEAFATLHQMSSRVVGQLLEPPAMARLMPALFPCGSITGAPKIRAMEIIREVEPHPRGVYCGAIGWMGPDGASAFNVGIRTLSITGSQVVLNVGGGVVYDSTASGEWEEAHWKARYAAGLTRSA